MNAFLESARTIVIDNPVTATFGATLATIFVYACWKFLRPLKSKARAFRAAAESLLSEADSEFSGESPFPGGHDRLRQLWSSYRQRYSRASVEIDGSTLSPIKPEGVFSRSRVLGGYNRGAAVALAGMFAGLGILGTFTGLLIGLEGVDTTTADRLLDSVTPRYS